MSPLPLFLPLALAVLYVCTRAPVCRTYVLDRARSSRAAQSTRYSTNDDEVVSRMIKSYETIISYLYGFYARARENVNDERA